MENKRLMSLSKWWAFSEYVIEDGRIRPAANAELTQYSPWDDYLRCQDDLGAEPGYLSLLKLMRDQDVVEWFDFVASKDLGAEDWRDNIEEGDEEMEQVAENAEKKICQWCAKHGLLGILTHTVSGIHFDSRRGSASFLRKPSGWEKVKIDNDYRLSKQGYLDIDYSALAAVGAESKERLRGLGYLREFFPLEDVPDEELVLALPFSKSFWEGYEEPLSSFLIQARGFSQSLYRLASKDAVADLTQDDLSRIEAYLAPVSIVFDKVGGVLQQSWTAPSLIAMLALMVMADLQENKKLFECTECGKLFVSNAYQARFCEQKCRFRYNKRESRARQKARELVAQGLPIHEIAERLKVDPAKLTSWLEE